MSPAADVGPDPRHVPPVLPEEVVRELAARYEMERVGLRPGLFAYIAHVWRYRHLMWAMAKGELISQHQDNYLGWLWSILTPLMLAGVYFLVFGVLIGGTRAGITNFVTFLTAGLFTFVVLSTALTTGSKSLLSKKGMMHALKFPRVLLPITTVLGSFVQQLPAFVVLILIALWQERTFTPAVLLYPVALFIVLLLATGMSMLLAPLVHWSRDIANIMPLAVRMLRYTSGVFFSIEGQLARFNNPPPIVEGILAYQPFAVSMTIVRQTLMLEFPLRLSSWLVAGGWAVLFFVVGFVAFWRGEGRYGRT